MANSQPVNVINKRRGTAQTKGVIPASLSTSSDYALPFFAYLTTPKNTALASFQSTTLKLPTGVIKKVWVEFPKGCAGLVGFRVFRGVRQIFPLPDSVWLKSDNAVLNFAFTENILTDPFEIVLHTYNLDDTYEHTIWAGFEMVGKNADLTPQMQQLLNALTG